MSGRRLGPAIESLVIEALERAEKVHPKQFDRRDVTVSVAVRDLATGEKVIDRLSHVPQRPASNMKVLTAGAALLGLGPNARFETRFELHGGVEGGVLRGDLVVRAGGDPMYDWQGDGSLERWFDPLIAALRAKGVARIAGRVVLDEGGFEKPGPALEWPAATDHWKSYCGLSGGFSANGGLFRVLVTPTSEGQSAKVKLRPRDHGLSRRGKVTTKGKANNVLIGATAATVTVGGSYPASSAPLDTDFRHPDPVDLFGHALTGALRRGSIELGNTSFSRTSVDAPGTHLFTMRSPIADVLVPILQESNNPVTDQLFLTLGHRLGQAGTRKEAARVVRESFAHAGHSDATWKQADGSGLSKANRVTAAQLADATLVLVRAKAPIRDAFLAALPESGASGSLERRMKGTSAERRVRAKTGWISGASALSGVILDDARRPTLSFSIIVGYPRLGALNNASWKPMQDEICALLCDEVSARRPVEASATGGRGGR